MQRSSQTFDSVKVGASPSSRENDHAPAASTRQRQRAFSSRNSLRAMIGEHKEAYSIAEFLQLYVPSLPSLDESLFQHHEGASAMDINDEPPITVSKLLKETVLTVIDNDEEELKPLKKVKMPPCNRQSLISLIDDCIWALSKHRRDRNKKSVVDRRRRRFNYSNSNLLSAGCIIAENNGSCLLEQRQLNVGTDFCKTSPLFQFLHEATGDDVLRYILMNTCIFIPVENHNYWQITGPPLHKHPPGKPPSRSKQCTAKHPNRRRKRKRPIKPLQTMMTNHHPLAPLSCINRRALFYSSSFTKSVGDGLLHQCDSPASLWSAMTADCNMKDLQEQPSQSVLDMCREILRRHGKTDYHRRLQHFCPLPVGYQNSTLPQLSQQFALTEGVIAFCQSCIASVFPSSFWGEKVQSSRKVIGGKKGATLCNETVILQQIVPTFVSLRRNERMANKMLIQNVRVTQITWLMNSKQGRALSRNDHERTRLLVLSILRWMFQGYLIPLLQSVFYVTESEFHAKRVLYYRKPVWTLFRTLSLNKLLGSSEEKTDGTDQSTTGNRKCQYTELSEMETAKRLSGQQMGLSRLRLLPKATGVRPIAMLSKRETFVQSIQPVQPGDDHRLPDAGGEGDDDDIEFDTPFGPARKKRRLEYASQANQSCKVPTNAVLSDAFAVLSYEYSRKPDTFGAGLRGMHDFYARYRRFVKQWKEEDNVDSCGRRKKLYFGSVDIRHCYDNIDQDYLLEIIDNILTEDEYLIQKFAVLHPVDGLGGIRRQYRKEVGPPEQCATFTTMVKDLVKHHRGSVFVDGVNVVVVRKQQIKDQLREHLKSHIVAAKGRFGNRYLLQSTGIPQGSILSSMLCNFYYGNIENGLLNKDERDSAPVNNAEILDLLARMIDDFLLITTDSSDAKRFFTSMYRGDASVGVQINSAKTKASVDVEVPIADGTTVTIDGGVHGNLFPWCGMLFDTWSGEVRNDYSRFFDGKGGDGLTVEHVGQEGEQLSRHMQLFVRPRCMPILFDPFINTAKTQATNFYQLMVLAAVKTAEYLLSSGNQTANQSAILTNTQFLLESIATAIHFAYDLIRGRLKTELKLLSADSSFKGLLRLDFAVWLGWKAFFDVFLRLPSDDFRGFAAKYLIHKTKCNGCLNVAKFVDLEKTAASALEDIQLEKLIEVSAAAFEEKSHDDKLVYLEVGQKNIADATQAAND